MLTGHLGILVTYRVPLVSRLSKVGPMVSGFKSGVPFGTSGNNWWLVVMEVASHSPFELLRYLSKGDLLSQLYWKMVDRS